MAKIRSLAQNLWSGISSPFEQGKNDPTISQSNVDGTKSNGFALVLAFVGMAGSLILLNGPKFYHLSGVPNATLKAYDDPSSTSGSVKLTVDRKLIEENFDDTTLMPSSTPSWFPTFDDCVEPVVQACQFPRTIRRGMHCGLFYEVFGSNSACMSNTVNGFQARWSPGDGNYLARKGIRPGNESQTITYTADFEPQGSDVGFSLLGAYGWTQDPLVEYYVVDSWEGLRPPIGAPTELGVLSVDGGVYDLYASVRRKKPSIEGIRTFPQFWSVRREKRSSGTISMAQHFEAWEPRGYVIGRFFEVSFVAEGFNTIGTANVNVTIE